MSAIASLNAPFGARCFLTRAIRRRNGQRSVRSLNPPFGARCFLTRRRHLHPRLRAPHVLMHLLALGGFWLGSHPALKKSAFPVLMHLMALGAF